MSGLLALPPILANASTLSVSCGPDSRSDFLARVHDAGRQLTEAGIGLGNRVAVESADPSTALRWFLGADLVGAACLIAETSWSPRERDAVFEDAKPDIVVDTLPASNSEPVVPAGDVSTHFYLPTTSGSSGQPRVLVRSRRSWLESFGAFDVGVAATDTVVVPGPLSSSLFLFGALHALHEGCELQLLTRWSVADTAAAAREATVMHVVPAMLAALVAVWEKRPAIREACALRKVVCGGAHVDSTLEQRLQRVLPGCELVEYYGSAEQSLVAIRHGAALRPAAGVDVEIRSAEGKPLPRASMGYLWTRSASHADGYLDHGEPCQENVRDPEQQWLSVGDRAVRYEDGSLSVHGRASSTFSSGAKNISAEEVEAVLRAVHGVLDVVVVPTPHPRLGAIVTAVLEVDPDAPPTPRCLREHAGNTLAPAKRPRRWLTTSDMPRTPAGKPARSWITERIRDGDLAAEVLA